MAAKQSRLQSGEAAGNHPDASAPAQVPDDISFEEVCMLLL